MKETQKQSPKELEPKEAPEVSGGQNYGGCIPLPDIVDGPTIFEPITNQTNLNQ